MTDVPTPDLDRQLGPAVRAAEARTSDIWIFAVGGGSCSGKTTVAGALGAMVAGSAILSMDDYYRPHQVDVELFDTNFDEPAALDLDLLAGHLEALCTGQAIEKPAYDFALHERVGCEPFGPHPVVILDGLFALHERLDSHVDYGLWVDCPDESRLRRRLGRDVNERGRTRSGILHQYEATVRPMHELHVERTRVRADLIVSNPGH